MEAYGAMTAVAISSMDERHHILRRKLLLGANIGPCVREYVSFLVVIYRQTEQLPRRMRTVVSALTVVEHTKLAWSWLRWLKIGFNKRWDIKRAKMRNEVSFDQLILVSDQSAVSCWLAGGRAGIPWQTPGPRILRTFPQDDLLNIRQEARSDQFFRLLTLKAVILNSVNSLLYNLIVGWSCKSCVGRVVVRTRLLPPS